jgi:hypothetical protein
MTLHTRPRSGEKYTVFPSFPEAPDFVADVHDQPEASGKPTRPGKPSAHIHAREYFAPNWFTTRGVLLKRRQIELKGIPCLKGYRFFTFTLNRDRFDSPVEGYLAGKDRMRRALAQLRDEGILPQDVSGFWKLEFHKDGWPHWHVLASRTEKMTEPEMRRVEQIWGLGMTSVEMVREDDFLYSFKYAFKPVLSGDEEHDGQQWTVPQWFLDYTGVKMVTVKWTDADGVEHTAREPKPTTFSRVRFFQTFGNFYTGVKPEAKERKEQKTWSIPLPVRTIAERVQSTVQVISREATGTYRKSAIIILTVAAAKLWHVAAWHAVGGNATFLRVNSAVIPTHVITSNTQPTWKIKELLQDNRLTQRRAEKLQQAGETLQRC